MCLPQTPHIILASGSYWELSHHVRNFWISWIVNSNFRNQISYIYIYIYSDSVCVACESEESQSFKLSHGPFQWYEHFIYPIMLLMFWAHSPISIVTCICLKSGRTQKCCHRPLKYRCPVTKSDNTRPTKPYEMPCGANGQLLVSLLVYIMWSLHLVHFDFYLFFEFGVIRWCMGK